MRYVNFAIKKKAIKEAIRHGNHTGEEISQWLKAFGYQGKKSDAQAIKMWIYNNMKGELTVKKGGDRKCHPDTNEYYLE